MSNTHSSIVHIEDPLFDYRHPDTFESLVRTLCGTWLPYRSEKLDRYSPLGSIMCSPCQAEQLRRQRALDARMR